MDDEYDPEVWRTLVHFGSEACVIALVALVVSLKQVAHDGELPGGTWDHGTRSSWLVRSNGLTRFVVRAGASYLAGEFAYGFGESMIAAVVVGGVVFFAVRGMLPLRR
jgi:hypothetical protein